MRSLEDSVATSMDCADAALVPYLPYILQDFWEIGSSPEVMLQLVRSIETRHSDLEVLDLGCGKGAVSITLAAALKCTCTGVDAIQEFIDEATEKAREYGVGSRCKFWTGDVRNAIHALGRFDVVILGAVGPVFGDYYETLVELEKHLKSDGVVIVDDGYTDDDSDYKRPGTLSRRVLLKQVDDANMKVMAEYALLDTRITCTTMVIGRK